MVYWHLQVDPLDQVSRWGWPQRVGPGPATQEVRADVAGLHRSGCFECENTWRTSGSEGSSGIGIPDGAQRLGRDGWSEDSAAQAATRRVRTARIHRGRQPGWTGHAPALAGIECTGACLHPLERIVRGLYRLNPAGSPWDRWRAKGGRWGSTSPKTWWLQAVGRRLRCRMHQEPRTKPQGVTKARAVGLRGQGHAGLVDGRKVGATGTTYGLMGAETVANRTRRSVCHHDEARFFR